MLVFRVLFILNKCHLRGHFSLFLAAWQIFFLCFVFGVLALDGALQEVE